MNFHTLVVLMWKHSWIRIRRFIHTTVELLSPIVFFLLLFSLRNLINPLPMSADVNHTRIEYTETFPLMNGRSTPENIFYYPETERTLQLMKTVGEKLKRTIKVYKPDFFMDKSGIYPLPNESIVNELFLTNHDAVLVFQNMEREEWPDKLKYSIRMKENFEIDFIEPFMLHLGSHSNFGDQYRSFMALQWAVDISFIEVLTGTKITQTLSLQEFPFFVKYENLGIKAFGEVFPYISAFSLILVFVFLVSRLLEEKATGVQELIKMVGVSTNMLGISHFLNVLPAGLVYSVIGTMLVSGFSNPLIPNTNGIFILIALLLHYVTIVALAFACSHIVKNTQYIVSIAVFCYIILWVPTEIIFSRNLPRAVTVLSGVLPHVPIIWFWKELTTLEQYGEAVTFSTMIHSHDSKSGSALLSYIMMLVQIALYFVISWYLSLVRPGKYGQALPWNFLFTKQYWTKNEVAPRSLLDPEEDEPIVHDKQFFEQAPDNLEVGIKIVNVSKVFSKQKALNNVSLEVYKGEITVLLGHNGAGKTTLMSIITGMMGATEGKVYVNGMDTVSQQDEVRKHLGLCPQHNLFFADLTVLEHVMFFTMLKGGSFKDARESSRQLLKSLGIEGKAHSKSGELSGGMKRRLQLACALAGGSDVLILDEPTSGLDVETRRGLWDLLLGLRGSRTVVLSTHFMEEAEALGDRVAALHHGSLRCHATTMHLKKAIGTGYRLSFTTIGAPKESAITLVVSSKVPDAALKEKTLNSLSYNLPAASSHHFPELFTRLESKRSELGIDSIGVGVSTLEEVFLKLCSDVDNSLTDEEIQGTSQGQKYNKLTGVPLYARQVLVLLKRQFKYLMSKKVTFLIMQVFIPILMLCVFTNSFNNHLWESNEKSTSITLNMDLYNVLPARRVFYNITSQGASIGALRTRNTKVEFEQTDDVAKAALDTAIKDITEYKKYLLGIELNDTDAKVLYTTLVRHAAPVAMNMLSNLLASQYVAGSDGSTIETINEPLISSRQIAKIPTVKEPKAIVLGLMWVIFVVLIILSTITNLASLACKELASGSRHIHVMSGCPPELHWFTTLLFHGTISTLVLIAPTLIITKCLDKDHTTDQADFLMTLLLILELGCLAFFALMYVITFKFSERATGIVLVALVLIFVFVTPVIMNARDLLEDDSQGVMYYITVFATYVMPPHTLSTGAMKAVRIARVNAYCHLNREMCPNLPAMSDFDSEFNTTTCCAGNNPCEYFSGDELSPVKEIVILFVQFLVFMCIVVLCERGIFNKLMDLAMNARYTPVARVDRSDMVRADAAYVAKAIELPTNQIKDAMLVHEVHKNYPKIIGKSCNAVKGISFSVKKGECFGLLGVNGAGKSTTFKMLTAEECTTRGKIFANGYHHHTNTGKYLRTLGYCPQFFGLDDFQTGKENLELLLTLRGLTFADVHTEVDNWIQVVGLEKYRNRVVSGYSGGCARRLAAAAALCSGAPLTLLDEPTAGVDVSARRRVWAALRRGLADERSLIITSHSMDEMEALCSSIAIMSCGEIKALGSAAALRAEHAAGHAVLIKVKHTRPNGDDVDSARSEMDRLKGTLHQTFDCTLKDEHKTMLHYHINETMRYSELFNQLENLKISFPHLVEDYSVTETTLEEVFLSFAKEQNESTSV